MKNKLIILKLSTPKVGDDALVKTWAGGQRTLYRVKPHAHLVKIIGTTGKKKKKVIAMYKGQRRLFGGNELAAVELKRNNLVNRIRYRKLRIA